MRACWAHISISDPVLVYHKPNDVQTQPQTFTQHLNQSSFASSFLIFHHFPAYLREKWNRELSGEKLYLFLLLSEQLDFPKRLIVTCLRPVSCRAQRFSKTSRRHWKNSHLTAEYPPTGTHCKWHMNDCLAVKVKLPSHNTKMHSMDKQLAYLRSFSSKEVATNVIRFSSYESLAMVPL